MITATGIELSLFCREVSKNKNLTKMLAALDIPQLP